MIHKRKIAFLILGITLITSINAQNSKIITLVADEWCPYNCDLNDEKPGFIVEIANEIFQKQGYTIEYIEASWNRAIFGTRSGQFDGIIGTGKLETPDFIFPETEQGLAQHTFYVLSGNTWQYSNYRSLDSITIGAIENYSYGSFWNSYIAPNKDDKQKVQIISGETPLLRNLKKLQAGRIDVTIEDKNVMNYFFTINNLSIKVVPAGLVKSEKIYIAFSPKNENADLYTKILDLGMTELRKSGRLAEILAKYNLKDWI